MAICPKCGAEADGRYCAKCGAPLDAPAAMVTPPDPVRPATAAGLPENTAAALCYIPGFIVAIIFLVLEPYRREPLIRFHAFQSIFLNVAMVIIWVVFTGFLPLGFYRLVTLLDLAFLVLWIYLFIQAYQGKKVLLPVIGDLAAKQSGV